MGWSCHTLAAGFWYTGRCGLTSMMSSRSGSRPARSSSSCFSPTCRERLPLALRVGGAACATITRGAKRAMIGPTGGSLPGRAPHGDPANGAAAPPAREAGAIASPPPGENLLQIQAQCPSDLQVLPVRARPQCGRQAVRDGRAEPETDPVHRVDQRHCFFHGGGGRPDPALPCVGATTDSIAGSPLWRAIRTFGSTPMEGASNKMTRAPFSSQQRCLENGGHPPRSPFSNSGVVPSPDASPPNPRRPGPPACWCARTTQRSTRCSAAAESCTGRESGNAPRTAEEVPAHLLRASRCGRP